MAKNHESDEGHGLPADLRMVSRRRMFGLFAGAAGLTLIGCTTTAANVDAATGTDASGTGACSTIPGETAGPYPGDGTNGANALALAGIVRSDIRASIGAATGVAAGVPLTVTLTLVDVATCSPLVGYAVYIWHCDRDGNYSMYTAAAANENYLRGVQVTDSAGQVTFTTIYPACYPGRWPHIHVEIYASVAAATNGSNNVAVSQLALPKGTNDAVFATPGYSQSAANVSQISLATDNVFSDGAASQIPTVTGSVAAGLAAALTVAITT